MLDGKMEVSNAETVAIIDSIFRSMAGIMAITKACHTGKRSSPDEFYKPRSLKKKPDKPIDKEGFSMMKKLFVKDAK